MIKELMFSPLSSWLGAWWPAGRHGAGELAESPTSRSIGSMRRKTLGLAWDFEPSKPSPQGTHLLHQGLTYCNRITPPNSSSHITSWLLRIQIYEPMGGHYYSNYHSRSHTAHCLPSEGSISDYSHNDNYNYRCSHLSVVQTEKQFSLLFLSYDSMLLSFPLLPV